MFSVDMTVEYERELERIANEAARQIKGDYLLWQRQVNRTADILFRETLPEHRSYANLRNSLIIAFGALARRACINAEKLRADARHSADALLAHLDSTIVASLYCPREVRHLCKAAADLPEDPLKVLDKIRRLLEQSPLIIPQEYFGLGAVKTVASRDEFGSEVQGTIQLGLGRIFPSLEQGPDCLQLPTVFGDFLARTLIHRAEHLARCLQEGNSLPFAGHGLIKAYMIDRVNMHLRKLKKLISPDLNEQARVAEAYIKIAQVYFAWYCEPDFTLLRHLQRSEAADLSKQTGLLWTALLGGEDRRKQIIVDLRKAMGIVTSHAAKPATDKPSRGNWLVAAVQYVSEYYQTHERAPSNAQVARVLGLHRSTLSKSEKYRRIIRPLRKGRGVPTGIVNPSDRQEEV